MPSTIAIEVTGRDLGATKVLDDVTASQRAAKKAAEESAKAQKLAAEVMQQSGGVVSEASLRMVKAKEQERRAAQELAKVQAAARKGYLEESEAARTTAAAMETLARAKMQVAAINAAPPPMAMAAPTARQSFQGAAEAMEKRELASQIGTHDFLRERMNERMGEFGISESMGGVTAGVAAATVVVGELANKMREAVAESLEFGEAMSRAAAKTGLSVETLSTLHYAAKTTGGDFEGMTSAVAKMDKTIGQATEGNKKAQAFMKALGLDAQDLAGREDGAEIAFQKFSSTLAATESPIRRVELATALLGKSGAEQIPTLIELGQHMDEFRAAAERAGVLLDGKTAEALRRTKDQLEELKQKATGAGLAFTEGFLPALDQMLTVFSGPGTEGMQAFKALGEDIGRAFEFAAGKLYETAAAAAGLAAVGAGGPLTDTGRKLAAKAEEYDTKSAKLQYAAVTGEQPKPTQEDRAYEAGLGKAPAGAADPMLEAIRKRNAARAEGFGGVGDLTGGVGGEHKAAEEKFRAMKDSLEQQKLLHGVSLQDEESYWQRMLAAAKQGSDLYKLIVPEVVKARQQIMGAFARASMQEAEEAERLNQQTHDSLLKTWHDLNKQDEHAAQAQESRVDTSNELYAIEQRTQMKLAEMAVRQQVGRTLTEEAAAMQMAAIHAHAYEAELARLEAKREAIASNPLLSNGEADQQRKIDQLTRQIAEMQAGRQIEVEQDAYAIKNADQSAVKGATDALHEFRMEALDTARQMHDLTLAIMDGVHRQLLNAVTGQKTDMRAVGRTAATGVADMALKKMEANAMDSMRPMLEKLGLGGLFQKKRDGSGPSTALYVVDVNGGKGANTSATTDLNKLMRLGLPGVPEYKDQGRGGPLDGLCAGFRMPEVQSESGGDTAGTDEGGGGWLTKAEHLFGLGKPPAGLPKLPGIDEHWGGGESGGAEADAATGLMAKVEGFFGRMFGHKGRPEATSDDASDLSSGVMGMGRLLGMGGKSNDGSAAAPFYVRSVDGGADGGAGIVSGMAGLLGVGGKADGKSASSPLYVKNVGGGSSSSGTGGLDSLFGGGDSGSGDGGDSGGFASLFGKMFGGGGDSSSAGGAGDGGLASLFSKLFGGGGDAAAGASGGGSMFAGLLEELSGAFAEGTDYAPGGMALVGEMGPEIVNLPRGSQVVPNKKLGEVGGGGGYHHHGDVHVDARGATNPAEVEAAGYRGAMRAIKQMGHPAAAMQDYHSRGPAGRR